MEPLIINLTRHKEASQRADYGSVKVRICANGSTREKAVERAEQGASQVSAICHTLICQDSTAQNQVSTHSIIQTPVTAMNNTHGGVKSFAASIALHSRLWDFASFRSGVDKLNQCSYVESLG